MDIRSFSNVKLDYQSFLRRSLRPSPSLGRKGFLVEFGRNEMVGVQTVRNVLGIASPVIVGHSILDVRTITLRLHSITITVEPYVSLPIQIHHSLSHRLRSGCLRDRTAGVFLRTDVDQVFFPGKTNTG